MDEIEERIDALGELNRENEVLLRMVRELREENAKLKEQVQELQEWIDMWDIEINEVTFYAPLDSAAVDGWDYCCDPDITASGAQVEIGRTIAAGPSVPFGTPVLVQGRGLYEVQDRGGLIHDGHLDIAVWRKSDAQAFGRQQVRVAYREVE